MYSNLKHETCLVLIIVSELNKDTKFLNVTVEYLYFIQYAHNK